MKKWLEYRVFQELKQSTTNTFYIELFVDRQNRREKIYSGIIALFSLFGFVSALISFFSNSVSLPIIGIVCTTISWGTVIFNKFNNIFLLSADDATKLPRIYVHISKYSDELQNLLFQIRKEQINIIEGQEKLTELNVKNSGYKIEASTIFGKMDKKLNKKAADKSDNYLNPIYNDD
ncbi:hypothetical protein EZS27_024474 [termite gut metagenome]|uniref:SMODS and SLOG-associating 2TM effector domain-containing protein n=1 Tax=termite gut metagenome TaxID=433724 RepID=A0A5J4QYG3_9ZZZZ